MRLVNKKLRNTLDFDDKTIRKMFLQPVWLEYKLLALQNYASRVKFVECFKSCAVSVFSDKLMVARHTFPALYHSLEELEQLRMTTDNFPQETHLPVTSTTKADVSLRNMKRIIAAPSRIRETLLITGYEEETIKYIMVEPEMLQDTEEYAESKMICNLSTYTWRDGYPANEARVKCSSNNTKVLIFGYLAAFKLLLARYSYTILEGVNYVESIDWTYDDRRIVHNVTSQRIMRTITPRDLNEMENKRVHSFPEELPNKLKTLQLPEPVPIYGANIEVITID